MTETVNNTKSSSSNGSPTVGSTGSGSTHSSHVPSSGRESTVRSLTSQLNSLRGEAARLRSEAGSLKADAGARENEAGELRASGDSDLLAQQESGGGSSETVRQASGALQQANDAIQQSRALADAAIHTAAEAESRDIYADATQTDITALTGQNASGSPPQEIRPGENNPDRGRITNTNPSPIRIA